jgi:type VI secretion system protein ImpJ
MTNRAIHWYDGMFLRAQHFQSTERHLAQTANRRQAWIAHFGWGVRDIDIDTDALLNNKLVIRALRACLRDGTMVAVPEDGALTALDLRPAAGRGSDHTVYLAVPALDLSRPNAAPRAAGTPVRFLTDTAEVADENTGDGAEQVRFRSLHFRLLLSSDDHTGYDVLPLVRLVPSAAHAGCMEIDPTYYPPLLAADGWGPFDRLIESVYHMIGRKADRLVAQLEARAGRDGSSEWVASATGQLRVLNEATAVLGVIGFTPGVPPLTAYTELCRLVGQLASFGPTRTVPDLPRYDHEDLGPRVLRLKQLLDALLALIVEPEYRERRFVGVGLRLQAELDPVWVREDWRLFIAAQSSLPEAELRALLADGSRFGLKVGSGTRVDELYRLGHPGLTLTPAARPEQLPAAAGEILLAVGRDVAREWEHVSATNTLGLRFNEGLVAGPLAGERVVALRLGPTPATLSFTLYAVPAWVETRHGGT